MKQNARWRAAEIQEWDRRVVSQSKIRGDDCRKLDVLADVLSRFDVCRRGKITPPKRTRRPTGRSRKQNGPAGKTCGAETIGCGKFATAPTKPNVPGGNPTGGKGLYKLENKLPE